MNGSGGDKWLGLLRPPRKLVERPEYSEQAKRIASSIRRLDEVLYGVTWALARHPENFPYAYPEEGIRVVKTDGYPDIPRLRIFFKHDEDTVDLLWIEPLPTE